MNIFITIYDEEDNCFSAIKNSKGEWELEHRVLDGLEVGQLTYSELIEIIKMIIEKGLTMNIEIKGNR